MMDRIEVFEWMEKLPGKGGKHLLYRMQTHPGGGYAIYVCPPDSMHDWIVELRFMPAFYDRDSWVVVNRGNCTTVKEAAEIVKNHMDFLKNMVKRVSKNNIEDILKMVEE